MDYEAILLTTDGEGKAAKRAALEAIKRESYEAGLEAAAVRVDARPHDPCDFAAWCHPADDDDRAAHKAWENKCYRPASDECAVGKQPRRYDLSDIQECGWLAWHAGAQYAMDRWRRWAANEIMALKEGGA